MGWRRLTGLIVLGVSLVALAVALFGLEAGAQPSPQQKEPVCAADAAATVAAQAQERTKALDPVYDPGLEALAPGGSRLCVTAAQMRAEAEAAQARQTGDEACGANVGGAAEAPASCVVTATPDGNAPSSPCGGADTGCGVQPDCGA